MPIAYKLQIIKDFQLPEEVLKTFFQLLVIDSKLRKYSPIPPSFVLHSLGEGGSPPQKKRPLTEPLDINYKTQQLLFIVDQCSYYFGSILSGTC
jgi:hypothetical protein